ncbi:MAG TPA: NAD(P)H-dependent oxidoreductase [Streptosporangiaceae bacterium]|nr:NAD(P)H-dependent oxidoreductase [Streptosporangiaceae bacterium]
MPLLDEPQPPSLGNYAQPHTNNWAQKIGSFDGFVFVTAEYNHSVPAALKNAIDFVYQEWNNKAAGFVSYGAAGGVRAVEHLRLALAEVQVADVANQVALQLSADFENYSTFAPRPMQQDMLTAMLDQLIAWSGALAMLRDGAHSRP